MMSENRGVALLFLAAAAACGGGGDDADQEDAGDDADSSTPDSGEPDGAGPDAGAPPGTDVSGFAFGIEYVEYFPALQELGQRVADAYDDFGGGAAKNTYLSWGTVEPGPPEGEVHDYRWTVPDGLVELWQSKGFSTITFVLGAAGSNRAAAFWGVESFPSEDCDANAGASRSPLPEHLEDYRDFVRAIVERYDGDGEDDMPGLGAPVRRFEIETEAQHLGFWQGDANPDGEPCPDFPGSECCRILPDGEMPAYAELLRAAHSAAREASEDAIIILAGLTFGDMFDDFPSDDVVEERSSSMSLIERQAHNIQYLVSLVDAYDEIELHLLDHYTGLVGIAGNVRGALEELGVDKPIWIGDSMSADAFFKSFGFALQIEEAQERNWLYEALTDEGHTDHGLVEPWYRAEQARYSVKTALVAMELGLGGAHYYGVTDVPLFWERDWQYQGLVDLEMGFGTIEGEGTPRPVYDALRALRTAVADKPFLSRLDLGDADVWAYRLLPGDGGPATTVLWLESSYVAPAETPPSADVDLPVGSASAFVRPIPTERGIEPQGEQLDAEGGVIHLAVTPTPIFVEEQ
ncbi:MAG: hypothetical protein HYY06_13575 [Deltaproteobacteria bacterium]|nr:hypothetical protein [Deltaproteobacteria bacterium]